MVYQKFVTLLAIVLFTIYLSKFATAQQAPIPSSGDNTACWSYSSTQEVSPQITCTPITPLLLLQLQFATRSSIQKVMDEPGEVLQDGTLRYEGNYDHGNSGYDGDVNFSFDSSGHAVIISADIGIPGANGQTAQYIWNAINKFFCSDIPIGVARCSDQ